MVFTQEIAQYILRSIGNNVNVAFTQAIEQLHTMNSVGNSVNVVLSDLTVHTLIPLVTINVVFTQAQYILLILFEISVLKDYKIHICFVI